MAFNKNAKLCEGYTHSGKPCLNPAMKDSDFCYQHRTDKEFGNSQDRIIDAWHEGPGGLEFNNPTMQETYDFVLNNIETDFDLNNSSDRMQSQMAAYYFVKWKESVKLEELDKAGVFDSLVRKNLHCLKATRDKREGIEVKVSTPAEWAAQLLAEHNNRKVKKEESKDSKADS